MSNKTKIAVVTDSAAAIPPALVQELGIHVIPYQLNWDGQTYLDGESLTPTEFYRRFRETDTYPTTSQPTPGTFIELYTRLTQQAEGIVSIHVAERLTGTVGVARQAAQEVSPASIRVVDSRTAAMPEGFLALAAARAAEAGADLDQVVSIVESYRERVGMFFALRTLEHLNRGGRIGQAAAHLGSRLQIQPILKLAGGQVRVAAGATRSRERAKERILDLVAAQVGARPIRASVFHGDAAEEADLMGQQVQERFHCIEFFVSEFTPVMGAHTRPGIIGVAFCLESDET